MALRLGDTAPDFQAETTQGPIRFHQWLGDSWGILFSHPKDFTPVCTTELGYMARIKPEFDKRNVKIIGLSADPVDRHSGWAKDIEETQGTAVNYPIIGDPDLAVQAHGGGQPDGAQRLCHRPRQEAQAHPHLSDDDGTQFRRGAARYRFNAAHRETQGRDAGELETGRGRDHRGLGLRRRRQEDLSARLEGAQTLYSDRAAAALVW